MGHQGLQHLLHGIMSIYNYVAGCLTRFPFPTGRPQFLASGDASGVIKVWRLSTELTNQSANEVEQLNSIALEALSTTTL